jgi:hypothetical protein
LYMGIGLGGLGVAVSVIYLVKSILKKEPQGEESK